MIDSLIELILNLFLILFLLHFIFKKIKSHYSDINFSTEAKANNISKLNIIFKTLGFTYLNGEGQFHRNCSEKKLIAICKKFGIKIINIERFHLEGASGTIFIFFILGNK